MDSSHPKNMLQKLQIIEKPVELFFLINFENFRSKTKTFQKNLQGKSLIKRSTGFSIICNFCSIFFGCDESICPLYMLTIYIWSTQKWPLRQSMCTHVAHTLNFSKNKKKGWNFFQLWEPCVPFGCTYFVSLYIYERFRYGSLSLQSIILLCKVEMQK